MKVKEVSTDQLTTSHDSIVDDATCNSDIIMQSHRTVEPEESNGSLKPPEVDQTQTTDILRECDIKKEPESETDGLSAEDSQSTIDKSVVNDDRCDLIQSQRNTDPEESNEFLEPMEDDRAQSSDILKECDIKQEPESETDEQSADDSQRLMEESEIKKEPESEVDEIPIDNYSSNKIDDGKIQNDTDPAFVLDYKGKGGPAPEYRITIDSSDSSDSSSDSSSEDESDSTGLEADVSEEETHEEVSEVKVTSCPKKKPPSYIKTKGELYPEDLPPLEELQITLDDSTQMLELGKISGIVGVLVIVQSNVDKPALNEDSVIFLQDRKVLGLVFETFGPVARPYYSVRFNSLEDIEAKGIEIGMTALFAPKEDEYTHYVFVQELLKMKGSDASWEDNNEPPSKYLDYSDDEQERHARKARKGGGDNEDNGEESKKKKVPTATLR